ncbi:MAG TPA: hypothetical protein VNN73_16800 [Blastocatellia bacterium]|nr:hypothetical protein [Blastocatellia bacterium]
MKRFFPPRRDFHSLSVKDLLEAREAYHVHLAHLENVVATAIGLYRIRETDPDAEDPKNWRDRRCSPPRTLQNTVVRRWSWPCLLVFVDKWATQEEMARQDPNQVVPRMLYMPDGRVVPTCVIFAEKQTAAPPPLQNLTFPGELIGGGYPLVTDVQGAPHVGSIGCLVTDGDSVYALTNRHVTGDEGREIFSFMQGKRVRIGTSHKSQIGKKLFKDVYHEWPGLRSYINLDAGLIHIDDLSYWTAQVFGIGELDEPVDLNTDTISLDLIGCPVRAFGGASGELIGEIQALFYRYRSIGGFEYVSDLLIGPRSKDKPIKTIPGDSGTLWFFDHEMSSEKAKERGAAGARARRLRPIALQWGGHALMDESGESKLQFALASCLSTICRELDVDVIPDWNIGHSEYWGKTGHYKIAATACALVTNQKLKKLLQNNLSVIAFDDQAIRDGMLKRIDSKQFVPLADVPDLVWRATRKIDEGNHFADMDQEGKGDFKGKTLLKLCEDPANLNIDVWNSFYDSLNIGFKRGALPFRVWQIYNDMVKFVSEGKIAEFVCAGGILSHYVGDACQPLHVSFLHHGRPGHPEENDVHSKYETSMLDRFAPDVIAGINQTLGNSKAKADVKGGHDAALSVIGLMRDTVKKLPPIKVIEAFNDANGNLGQMWNTLGKRTTSCMADGCLRLAALWASAWREGGGNKIPASKLGEVNRNTLKALYNNKNFLPAFRLKDPKFAQALSQ